MNGGFKLLGVLVGCYVGHGLATGEVFAKSRLFGRTVRRDEDAYRYGSAIGAYALLTVALLFFF